MKNVNMKNMKVFKSMNIKVLTIPLFSKKPSKCLLLSLAPCLGEGSGLACLTLILEGLCVCAGELLVDSWRRDQIGSKCSISSENTEEIKVYNK